MSYDDPQWHDNYFEPGPEDALAEAFEDGWYAGYSKGFADGYESGCYTAGLED